MSKELKEDVSDEKDDKISISLKIDKDLLSKIKEHAENEYRSVNKQIIYLIHCGLEKTLEKKVE